MAFIRKYISKNGSEIKHSRNRKVGVYRVKIKGKDEHSCFISFARMDDEPKLTTNICEKKHGAVFTGIPISDKAAFALMHLLAEYFKRNEIDVNKF